MYINQLHMVKNVIQQEATFNLGVELLTLASFYTSLCYVYAVGVKVWVAGHCFKITTHSVKMLRQ